MAFSWFENRGLFDLEDLHRRMERLFSEWEGWPALAGAAEFPAVNVYDAGKEMILRAEIPGMELAQIDVSVMGDMVTLKGDRKPEPGADKAAGKPTPQRMERVTGGFSRSVRLPEPALAEQAAARYANGILEVRLPKRPEAAPRRIAIAST